MKATVEYLDNEVYELRDEMHGLEIRMKNLMSEIKEFKAVEKPDMGTPKKGEKYYCIGFTGIICCYCWNNDTIDNKVFLHGHCFWCKGAEQRAEQYLEHLNAVGKIRLAAKKSWGDVKIDWEDRNQEKWYAYWHSLFNKIHTYYTHIWKNPLIIYFPSKESAEQAFESLTEQERKAYFKL